MLRARDIREAIAWIDRSRVAPDLETLLRPTQRGRPRQLTVRALLVGLKLAVDTAKTGCLTDVHVLLTEALPRSVQIELGTYQPATGTSVTLPQVRRLLTAIQAKLDPSPHTAGDLTPAERDDRAAILQSILDRLLAATMPGGVVHPGGYAVDGTGTWSWSRGKRHGETTADPDAAWGTKTHKNGKSESYFGYELHAVVRINPTGAPISSVPCVAERIVVLPASTNGTAPVLQALARMKSDGLRVHDIAADRGYSYKLDWTPGLLALDLDPVHDLHATQFGARGTHAGARIVAGVPHCPAMPELFDSIARPGRLAAGPELETFIGQIEQRGQWALRRVAGPDTSGKERYECPARAGKLRCPAHPASMALPLALPKVSRPPTEAPMPTCCSQRTITVPGEVDAKSRQRHYWGSRAWVAAFSRRSRVEGWFGNLKNDNAEALGRGAFRIMGICKTSLMLGIYAAATNLRLLRAWAGRALGNDDLTPLLKSESPDRPEERDRRPAGETPGTGPPPTT